MLHFHDGFMSKLQLLLTILVTTVFVGGAIGVANHFYGEKRLPQANSVQTSRTLPSPKVAAQAEAFPRTIEGRVVGVTDGDTITVLTAENKQYKIRLAGIDAPERGQDFGTKSSDSLSKLIFNQIVRIAATKLDKYGRTIGKVFIGEKDMNLELVREGMAWHYKQYEDEQSEQDRKTYAEAEIQSRTKKIGLWSMPNPVPPWVYRHPELAQPTVKGNS